MSSPKYDVGSMWVNPSGYSATIESVSNDTYVVSFAYSQMPIMYSCTFIDSHIQHCIEAGLINSLKPYLEVGKVYWSVKEGSTVCFWRKYFGDDKWSTSYDKKEDAEQAYHLYPGNTGKITVAFSDDILAQTVPAKKKPRCLNPA